MKRWDIINRFIDVYSKYLEIGVDQGETWKNIVCTVKVGVDPNSKLATRLMTSDQYFVDCRNHFDVIFIDGLHLEKQVDRDIKNARKHLAEGGTIILHDCLPRTMENAQTRRLVPEWYGTVWRSAVKLALDPLVDFSVVDADAGCGILKEGVQAVPPVSIEDALDPDYFFQNARKIYRIVP